MVDYYDDEFVHNDEGCYSDFDEDEYWDEEDDYREYYLDRSPWQCIIVISLQQKENKSVCQSEALAKTQGPRN